MHVKQPEGCESKPLDPEDGIDSDTSLRVLDRNRETTKSGSEILVEDQWAELWLLIFPSDNLAVIPLYSEWYLRVSEEQIICTGRLLTLAEYQAVMEDCELETEYLALLPLVEDSLQRQFGLSNNENTSRELREMLTENFNIAVESCHEKARNVEYTNRANTNRFIRGKSGRASAMQNLAGQLGLRDSGIGTETSSNSGHMSLPPQPASQLFYANNSSETHRASLETSYGRASIPPTTENLAEDQAPLLTAGRGQVFSPLGPNYHAPVADAGSLDITQPRVPAQSSGGVQSYAGRHPYMESQSPYSYGQSPMQPQAHMNNSYDSQYIGINSYEHGDSGYPQIQPHSLLQHANAGYNDIASASSQQLAGGGFDATDTDYLENPNVI